MTVQDSTTSTVDYALDLLRRMPPEKLPVHLRMLCLLRPDMTTAFLSHIDVPLKTLEDPVSHQEFLICEVNREGHCYRSPHSNTFISMDGMVVASKDVLEEPLRSLEIALNNAFRTYKDMYTFIDIGIMKLESMLRDTVCAAAMSGHCKTKATLPWRFWLNEVPIPLRYSH